MWRPAPRLSVPAFLEFGVVRSGAPSDIGLELRNVGNAPLQITALALDANGSPRFTLVAPPALPLIAPSGSTTATVRFDPIANGPLRGALTVSGGGQRQVVMLSGEGTTSAAGMVAVLFEQLGIGQAGDVVV